MPGEHAGLEGVGDRGGVRGLPSSRSSRSSSRLAPPRELMAAACFTAERSNVSSPSFASGEGGSARSRTPREEKAAKSAAVWYVPAPCLVAPVPVLRPDGSGAGPPGRVGGGGGGRRVGSRVLLELALVLLLQPGLPRTGRWEPTGGLVTTVVVVAGEVDLHARPGGAERRPAVVRRARRAVARGAALPIVRVVSPLAPGEEVGTARGLSRGSGARPVTAGSVRPSRDRAPLRASPARWGSASRARR